MVPAYMRHKDATQVTGCISPNSETVHALMNAFALPCGPGEHTGDHRERHARVCADYWDWQWADLPRVLGARLRYRIVVHARERVMLVGAHR